MLELVEDIESSFKNLGPPMSGDCCIYRVPHNLRIVLNEDAYTPYAVSIGPLHHGRKELEPMEKVKLRYLQEFINHTHSILHDLVCFIKNMEDRIRNCYAETILFNSNEFVKMILIDAAFIILHFAKYCCDQHDEVLLRNSCLMSSICRDMMLLENQIPFFVLTELYNLKRQAFLRTTVFPFGQDEGLPPFEELAWYFFKIFFRWHWGIVRNVPENVKHFTDMLRFSHVKPDLTPGEFIIHRGGKYKLRCNASELWEAGVNIKVAYSRLDGCEFDGAVLKIPQLELNGFTTCLLQNLMALEMCHYPLKTTICDYISLMDHLMETSKDVDLMVQKEILVNGLGDSNEIVTLVKKLGTHIPQDCQSSRYAWLFMRLNRHCENRWVKPKYQDNIWQKRLKILKDEYFSTPWRSASTIAAIILLVLTFIQTVFAIIKE